MDKRYKSSIPVGARERVITEYRCEGSPSEGGCSIFLQTNECWYRGRLVGRRWYDEKGRIMQETPLKGGKIHGVAYTWYDSGELESSEPYFDGLVHGTAKQWSVDGRLMGTYTLHHGTGWDLWWNQDSDGSFYISEVHGVSDGYKDGFTWCMWADSLWSEEHYHSGYQHGIERRWNTQRRLSRGYPKYFIQGKQVTKRVYIRATKSDPTLPLFQIEDHIPVREFPSSLRETMGLA